MVNDTRRKMKIIFWNVDTQYDFMRDDESFKGALPIPGARDIEGNLARLTKFAKQNGIYVVNDMDWHYLGDEEISDDPDFVNTFPPHCIANTPGAEFVPATKPENVYRIGRDAKEIDLRRLREVRNLLIEKGEFDVFSGNPLTERTVEILDPKEAVVYGVATNVCVDYVVKGLLKRGVEVLVPQDAIKELPNLALPYDDWKEKGAKLTNTDEVCKFIELKGGGR